MSRDVVVSVHGFLGNKYQFFPMAHWLDVSHRFYFWGHTTVRKSVEEYAKDLVEYVLSLNEVGPIYFVGHSMGAIIVRAALPFLKTELILGRAVLIAPPNRGSWVPRFLPSSIHKVVPAVSELSDNPQSYVCSLPEWVPCECGVIWSKMDHMVRPDKVLLKGVTASIQVGGLHTGMLFSKRVALLVGKFLSQGTF